ncbi:TonB-dependent receptor [Hydrocarboniphaga sp.]|uniref:TonB-dependent receptor n=1 Tax=Hydrocarboniphaga sp. TaxID=2033016 RepID=UPI002630501B|nr:TonB-dependent receptor [Hydrocarboniphaga sp.]
MIEEVIVTSQKREENLRDVPISISAFTADTLEAKGVTTVKDLTQITPGLQYDEVASFSTIFLRGVGTDAFIPTADASVATYIDGIYYPSSNSLAQDLGSLERIEVLKGPQGTLFGRNSTGGAISIITRKPSFTPEFTTRLTLGNFNEQQARVFVTGPVSDTVAASSSIIRNTADSYYSLTADSPLQSLVGTRNLGVQTKLLWKPVDDFDLLLNATKVQLRAAGTSLFRANEDVKPLGYILGVRPDTGNPYEVALSAEPFNFTNNNVGSLEANYRPAWFDVKLLASYQQISSDSQNDYDGSPVDLVTFRSSNLFSKVFTSEIQLISNNDGWMADKLKWIVGGYFIKSRAGFDPVDVVVGNNTIPRLGDISAPVISQLGLPLVQQVLDQANAILGPTQGLLGTIAGIPIPPGAIGVPNGTAVRISAYMDTLSPSIFAQSTYNFTEQLALTLGGRYQTEKRTLVQSNAGVLNTDGSYTSLFVFPEDSGSSHNFSPKVTLDYKPYEGSLIYLTYAKGFRSGTFNCVNILKAPEFVKPETTTSYELGTKTDFFDRRLRVSAAVFQNQIQDLQVQFVSILSGGIVSLENAAKATISGADFDVQWAITPSLVATAGGAYLHGRFDSYPDGRGYNPITGIYQSGFDFSGNTTVRTPEFSGSAGLSYTIDMSGGPLEIAADTYYNSGFYYDNQNTTQQPAYQIYGARASYLYEPWNLRLTAAVRNITNQSYYLYRLVGDFDTGDTLAAPRNYGLSVDWTF